MDLVAGLDLIRPWMTTGFIAGILGIAVKLFVDNRRLRLAEVARDQDFQLKMSGDGRTNLQFIIDNLVRDITSQREEHAKCEAELNILKESSRKQEQKLDGLSRQLIAYQLEVGRAIPPELRTPVLEELLRQWNDLEKRDV